MVQISNDPYKQDDSPLTALKMLERHLLQDAKSHDSIARAISRVQCVNALQVVLNSTNEKVLQPEESYRLTADYGIRKGKNGVCPDGISSARRT